MAEDSKIILLPKNPSYVPEDPNIAAELQKIYDTINILAQKAETLVGTEDYSQAERAAFWAAGNVPNSKLALAARKLMRYGTNAVPGDVIRFVAGSESTLVGTGTSMGGQVFGFCIDSVTAGSNAFVYFKGVVPFTKFSLTPGRCYGVYDDPGEGNTNSLFPCTSVDAGSSSNDTSLVGIAISPNSLLLQCDQFG